LLNQIGAAVTVKGNKKFRSTKISFPNVAPYLLRVNPWSLKAVEIFFLKITFILVDDRPDEV